MRDRNQVLMYNEKELALIKAVFADNETFLYIIRNVLLQFPLTMDEWGILRASMNEEVYTILKKRIFAKCDPSSPLGQMTDFHYGADADLKTKNVEEMAPLFAAKQLEIDYFNQQFAILKGEKVAEVIKLDDLATLTGKKPLQMYIDSKARNFILSYVDQMLIFIKSIAGQKTESIEDAKKRMTRDSTK